jgi:hypothetical protein
VKALAKVAAAGQKIYTLTAQNAAMAVFVNIVVAFPYAAFNNSSLALGGSFTGLSHTSL